MNKTKLVAISQPAMHKASVMKVAMRKKGINMSLGAIVSKAVLRYHEDVDGEKQ